MAVEEELREPHSIPPRAPSQAVWNAMTPSEREVVVRTLPSMLLETTTSSPEGDLHFETRAELREVLRSFFAHSGRRVHISSELAVYYPDEERFVPDLFAVRDVESHSRDKWVVSAEKRGLDWVLDVTTTGERYKSLEQNLRRYARLKIPEYFFFDRSRGFLRGYRLFDATMGIYQSIPSRNGLIRSEVLGLDLAVENRRLRFRHGNAELLSLPEVFERLGARVDEISLLNEEEVLARVEAEQLAAEESRMHQETRQRADDAERRMSEAEQRVDEETQLREAAEGRADRAEKKLQEAIAEIERLRRDLDARG